MVRVVKVSGGRRVEDPVMVRVVKVSEGRRIP